MFRRSITCEHSSGRCRPRGILWNFGDIVGVFRVYQRRVEARDHMRWFKEHLKSPPEEVFRSGRGRCWFRTEASDMRERMQSLVVLLQLEGFRTLEVASMDPGLITYRDDHQVVAIPYRLLPIR